MPLAWAATLLYTLARLIDYADGYVARVTGSESSLGAILDIEFDGLGLLIAVLLAIQYGLMPLWYLPLALARQLFVLGLWLRTRRGLAVYPLPDSDNRRLIAGYQTGFLAVVLWPIFGPPLTLLASVLFAIPLAFSFGRDWLVVSGVLDPQSDQYARGRQLIKTFFEGWLPFVARIIGAWLAAMLLWRMAPTFEAWGDYLASLGAANPDQLARIFAGLFALAWLPFLLGIVGRLSGLIILGMACLDVLSVGLLWHENGWLFVCAAIVLHLGSGRFALWRPEDAILRRRWGGPREDSP
ncbi:MAG: CDP-alcohol phosphatidyltransferase family protein [Caldilineaceae bacterium]|nr:CDP-alcohol phosphatidyltransferase family protein [Caldilineaceae bacterium]